MNKSHQMIYYQHRHDKRSSALTPEPSLFYIITLTLYMVLPLFVTRFADYAGGIRLSFIQPRLV